MVAGWPLPEHHGIEGGQMRVSLLHGLFTCAEMGGISGAVLGSLH